MKTNYEKVYFKPIEEEVRWEVFANDEWDITLGEIRRRYTDSPWKFCPDVECGHPMTFTALELADISAFMRELNDVVKTPVESQLHSCDSEGIVNNEY